MLLDGFNHKKPDWECCCLRPTGRSFSLFVPDAAQPKDPTFSFWLGASNKKQWFERCYWTKRTASPARLLLVEQDEQEAPAACKLLPWVNNTKTQKESCWGASKGDKT
jgi:hypothetical protein